MDQSYLLTYAEGACADADAIAHEQRTAREFLQKRAIELLMEVEPVSQGDLTVRAAAQTTASTKVSHTMEQVADIANKTSVRSVTVAASFENLVEVADALQVSVAKFKV